MIRSRDFFLLFSCIVFLLVAIGTTLITRSSSPLESGQPVVFVPESETEGAVLADAFSVSREDRLAAMKEKLAKDSSLFLYEEAQVAEPEPEEVEEPLDSELRCANYQSYAKVWNNTGVTLAEQEGIRFVYKEAAVTTGTSTPTTNRIILAELPVRNVSFGGQFCIPSDVIGITTSGSLIRNTDAAIYVPLGEDSLLGYALDGYPIYGTSNAQTDSCGGHTVAGQYRYQLSPLRDTVITCFSATPVSI